MANIMWQKILCVGESSLGCVDLGMFLLIKTDFC